MKLYIFEHCPFCCRVRLALGIKNVPVTLDVLMEDDSATPTAMVGKKAVPILEKDDGTFMGESLDIVRYIDQLGTPLLDGPGDPVLDAWTEKAWGPACKLFIPRFTRGSFPEIETPQARQAFIDRETKVFGDLERLLDKCSPALIDEMEALLDELEPLLASRDTLSISDITLWPVLRSLSIVRGLNFPPAVYAYMRRGEVISGAALLFDQSI